MAQHPEQNLRATRRHDEAEKRYGHIQDPFLGGGPAQTLRAAARFPGEKDIQR
jgi:hypothetical protein